MKNHVIGLLSIFGTLLFLNIGNAQTNTINYTADYNTNFTNPDRGWYEQFDNFDEQNAPFNIDNLRAFCATKKISMIKKYYLLRLYKNSPISQSMLNNLQTDLNICRQLGIKLIPSFRYNAGEGQPAPNAPIEYILSHIDQLAPVLTNNKDVIAFIKMGFIGAYGEWHDATDPTLTEMPKKGQVADKILAVWPTDRMITLRAARDKREIYGRTPITVNEAYNGSNRSRIGFDNDSFGTNEIDYGTYYFGEGPGRTADAELAKVFLAQEGSFVPVSGETSGLCGEEAGDYIYRQCDYAVDIMKRLKYSSMTHYEEFDTNAGCSTIPIWNNGGCEPEMRLKLGYRFRLIDAVIPASINPGSNLSMSFNIANDGWANPYNPRGLEIVLRNKLTNVEFFVPVTDGLSIPSDRTKDPRFWTTNTTTTVNINQAISANIPAGNYDVFLHLFAPEASIKTRPEYAIQLANQNVWEANTGYNSLKTTIVVNGASTVSVSSISLNPVSATILVNGTQQLNAIVAPANATNNNVSWSSSNTAVASVNNTGFVTGIAAGNATITATTQDGNKTATSQITVNPLSSNNTTIVSAPSTISQNSTNELRISYSAAQAGRIWAGFFDSSWKYIGGGSDYFVNANTSGIISINTTVPDVPAGTGYKWYIALVDSNNTTIDGTEKVQENVTVTGATTPTSSNSTTIVSAPSTISQNSTNELRISYSAAQAGRIWAGFFDSSWKYIGGGSDYFVNANTSGIISINTTVPDVPAGTGYKWYIALVDSNNTTIDGTEKVQENVTVTGVTTASLLLINPGFEDGLSSGWTNDWGGNGIITTQIKNSGVNALQIGSQSGGRAQRITAGFTAGNQYTLSAWARLSSAGSVGNIGVLCKNSSGAQLGNFYGSPITNFDAFLNKSVTFTVPAGTTSMEVYAYYDGSSSGKLYVDDFNLVTTTPAAISNKNSEINNFKVDVYPNPVVSNLNLTYNLKTAGNVTFQINNSYGNQIKQFASKAKVAGEQTFNMDVSDLKNGIYFIRITNSDGEQVIKKILVNNK